MKNVIICCCLIFTTSLFSQKAYSDCAAICLNKVALVKDYSPSGICEVSLDGKGVLSVFTVALSERAISPQKPILFKIAIRDAETQTIWIYAEKTFETIDMEEILANCQKGDHILVMTVDQTYALPHNEILVK